MQPNFFFLQQYSKTFYSCTWIVVYPNCNVPYLHYVWISWNHYNYIPKLWCIRFWEIFHCCTRIVMDPHWGVVDLHSSWSTFILMFQFLIGTTFPQVGRAFKASMSVPILQCTRFVYWPFCIDKTRQYKTRRDETRRDKTRRIKIDKALVLRT